MRDTILTAIVGALLLATFRHPVVGAYLWAWLSMMNPHKLTYGFAFSLPFAQVTAAITLAMLVFTSRRQALPMTGIVFTLLAMLGWMTVTSFFAIAHVDDVLDKWIFVAKIQVMLVATWMLVREPAQIRTLIWIVTMSIGIYGVKGGLFTLMTGGGGRVWGPPGGLVQGNNELAVALVVSVPMMYFLHQTEKRKWIRHLMAASIVICAFAILGTQSRGALLSLTAMAFFLGLLSKKKLRTSLLMVFLVAVAIGFMPESWLNRMDTIGSYQQDDSAMSRIWTWKTMLAVAMDRPLVGAGFAADNLAVFGKYAPTEPPYDIFTGRVYVAHSIYFQMLGEHGFVGLGLFLLLGIVTWRTSSAVSREAQASEEYASWMPLLMRMVQVSIIGFAIGGAFLSLAYFDVPYYVMGYVVLCKALLLSRSTNRAAASPAATPGPQQGLARPPGGPS